MDDKIFYTVIFTSLLIAIIIVFFIISVIRYHRRYINLQKERLHAEIMIQEMERKRIANDLHDSLGPLLSTVKLYLQSIAVDSSEDRALY
jgi:signal transduction histidine kinase